MFGNKIKIAFRHLLKNKTFSIINILGLALGMACCFLTLLYCWHEFNYDTFHEDADQIYQVEYRIKRGEVIKIARIPSPIGPVLVDFFPEMEAASRFYGRELSVENEETQAQFEIENVYFVDSTALDVFEFDFLLEDSSMLESEGTWVYMRIVRNSSRQLKSVFDNYTSGPDDFNFNKTVIPVRLASYENENLVSRSQAKRLLLRVERFQNVVFDFDGVSKIGQAFADEIFRVYAAKHPDLMLLPIEMNEDVEFMVNRALSHGKT